MRHARRFQVLLRRHADLRSELTQKMKPAQPRARGECLEGDALVAVFVDVAAKAAHIFVHASIMPQTAARFYPFLAVSGSRSSAARAAFASRSRPSAASFF